MSKFHNHLVLIFVLLTFLTNTQIVLAQWQQTNGPYGGSIRAMVVSGDNIFVGTSAGVFLSTDNGAVWTAVNNGLPDNVIVNALAINGNNIFAGTHSDGMFLSTNNGLNWSSVNTGLTGKHIRALSVMGANLFAATSFEGVFLSTNDGATWTAVNNGLPNNVIVHDLLVDDGNIFAGTGDGVFLSTNIGTTWNEVNTGFINKDINALAVSGNNILASNGDGVYFSEDNGTNWNLKNNGLINTGNIWALAVSGNNIFAGSNGGGVFLSTNNGTSWNAINSGLTNTVINDIAINENNIFAGTGNGIFLSTDNGSNWNAVNNGLNIAGIYSLEIMDEDIYVGTEGGGVFHSSNNGSNWNTLNIKTYGGIVSLDISGDNIFAGTAYYGLLLSTDRGLSWNHADGSGLSDSYIKLIKIIGDNIFVSGGSGGVYRSTNNGVTWTTVSVGSTNIGLSAIEASGNNIYACNGSGVYLSANNGTSWSVMNSGLTNTNVTALAISGANMFVGTQYGGIFRSTNNGATWIEVNNGLTNLNITALDITENNIYVGTDDGVFLSTNNGTNWTEISTGLINKNVLALDASTTNIFTIIDGSGIFTLPLANIVPLIEVTNPNGGENWQTGTKHSITWTSNNVKNFKIELSTDNASNWTQLTNLSTTGGSGNFNWSWTIPDTLSSSQCKIRVSDSSDPTIVDESDGVFTISGPTIKLISPTVGEIVKTWIINFSWEDVTNATSYRLNVRGDQNIGEDGGFLWAGGIISKNYSYDFSSIHESYLGSTLYWGVQPIDSNGVKGNWSKIGSFVYDPQNNITITSPNGGENWEVGSTQNITWTSENIGNVKIEYTIDNDSTWTTIVTSTVSDGSYDWTIPNSTSTLCKIRISDAANPSVFDVSDSVFTIGDENQPIAFYPFNGNANDESGNMNHGTVNGATLTIDRFGNPDRAFNFNGSNQYIEINNSGELQIKPDITISCWINSSIAKANLRQEIYEKGRTSDGWEYQAYLGSGVIVFQIGNQAGTGDYIAVSSQDIITENEWYNIVVVFKDGQYLKLYVNNKLEAANNSFDNAYAYSPGNSTFTVGIRKGWYSNEQLDFPFNGKIDDVKIYNYALSESEIENIYEEGGWNGAKTIILTSPNGGENWQVGSAQNIIWTGENVANVKLEYSIDNGSNWINIISSTNSDGSYEWNIPNANSAGCLVRVTDAEDSRVFDVSDNVFSINTSCVPVSISSEPQDQTANIGGTATFSVNVSGTEPFQYFWYKNNVQIPGASSTSYTTPILTSSDNGNYYYCNITNCDFQSGVTTRNAILTVNTSTASISVITPSNGNIIKAGSNENITWTAQNIENVKIEYSASNISQWVTIVGSTPASNNSYSWTVPNIESNSCKIRISDASNSSILSVSGAFTIFVYPTYFSLSKTMSFGSISETSSYRMVGIPGNVSIPISQTLEGSHGEDWKVFWDDGKEPLSYKEWDGTSTFNFGKGRAFWVVSKKSFNISNQVSSGTLNTANAYEIPIHPGWNMITNPFTKVVSWSVVKDSNNVTQVIHYYNGNKSTPNDFEPYKGYYFYNAPPYLSSLKIPYLTSSSLGKTHNVKKKELSLLIESREYHSQIFIGFEDSSKIGYDKNDQFAPPGNFDVMNIQLKNDNLETSYKYLMSDYRPEIGEGQVYDVKVKLVPGETYTFKIDGLEAVEGYETYLIDERLSKFYNLKEQAEFQYTGIHETNNFKLIIGKSSFVEDMKEQLLPKEFVLYQNYPNPFNPNTVIRFTLPEKSNVSITVYNILGEVVNRLIRDKIYPAGNYETLFEGERLTSGVYIYEIRVNGNDSGENFSTARKMLYVK